MRTSNKTCTRCGGDGHTPANCPWVAALAPVPKRGLLARVLLDGMSWTDSHQGVMLTGAALCCALALMVTP